MILRTGLHATAVLGAVLGGILATSAWAFPAHAAPPRSSQTVVCESGVCVLEEGQCAPFAGQLMSNNVAANLVAAVATATTAAQLKCDKDKGLMSADHVLALSVAHNALEAEKKKRGVSDARADSAFRRAEALSAWYRHPALLVALGAAAGVVVGRVLP